jgi:hypothetical protein
MGDNTVLAVLAFVGIFVVLFGLKYLLGKLTDKAGDKIHQVINKGDLNRQNELYAQTWEWKVSTSWADIRAAIEQELANISESLPGLRIVAENESGVRVGFNFKGLRVSQGAIHYGGANNSGAGDGYEFQGDIDKTDTGVEFSFVQIKTFAGVGRCVSEMEELLALVERAVKIADPTAEEVSN